MKFTPTPLAIKDLIEAAEDGRLALPEFQRTFIWKPTHVADFLRTVARDWPAGSFLMLEGPQKFSYKAIEGAPKLGREPEHLILDGQQRMTAIYQALKNESEETYFIEMGPLIAGEAFEDDHLRFEKQAKFKKQFPTLKQMAEARLIPVHMVGDDKEFLRWTKYLSETEQETAFAVRDAQLSGFKAYYMPSVVLPKDTALPALAKIFETINRTGVRLDAFDLMVARLYPADFRLRDEWSDAREIYDEFATYEVEGLEILKLVALWEHLRQHGANVKPLTVKGVRESDVLNLDVETVKARWHWAIEAYKKALNFVKARCGALANYLLPAHTILLPLSDALGQDAPTRANFEKDLERWFWTTSFGQTYSQGANTQAVSDARALRAWRIDPNAVPETVKDFKLDITALEDQRRRNEMLVRGIGCLLVKRGARDWIEAHELASATKPLEFHHIYATKYLQNLGIEEADVVANITLLFRSTNQSLRNDAPDTVCARTDVKRAAVETHALSWDAFKAGSWNDFVRDRADKLAVLIEEVTS